MADAFFGGAGTTLAPFITALRKAIYLNVNTHEFYYCSTICLSNVRTYMWQIFFGSSHALKGSVTLKIKLLALRAPNTKYIKKKTAY
jgi:hypothetical protein